MLAESLARQAKLEIQTQGGISIGTGMKLEALGYNVERLEALIINSIKVKK
jgi:hypothetical protein